MRGVSGKWKQKQCFTALLTTHLATTNRMTNPVFLPALFLPRYPTPVSVSIPHSHRSDRSSFLATACSRHGVSDSVENMSKLNLNSEQQKEKKKICFAH